MVNGLVQEWITDKNRVVVVQAPEKATVQVPTREQILATFAKVNAKALDPYDDHVSVASLVPVPPTPGT